MNKTEIPVFSASTPAAVIADALEQAGCAVVTGMQDTVDRAAVREELAPHMARARVQTKDDPAAFYAGHTRRTTALVARSQIAAAMVLNPISTALCDRFLLPNSEFGYHLHATAALEIGPGARAQILHTEDGPYTFFKRPRPHLIVASMWAISDFRADNGATLVVPGSHTWSAKRIAQPHEIVPAEMPAGSVLYWLGGTLHAAGANVATDWRYGIILTYSLGWLRQEENQYLDTPPDVAASLSPALRDIVGYRMHQALGYSVDKRVGGLPN